MNRPISTRDFYRPQKSNDLHQLKKGRVQTQNNFLGSSRQQGEQYKADIVPQVSG